MNSEYQTFWVTHDILKISPEAILDFDFKTKATVMSINNSKLSYSQIQLIFQENLIEFEEIS
tara:strand:- start:155 stop:340 length:186 start_codon:yes stop_codon:yes gene_type:complete